jgi:hypothetical protein
MKRLLAIASISALGVVGIAFGPAAQANVGAHSPTPLVATASHKCKSGYKHARTPGGPKCLHAGQYCSHKRGYAKAYRRAGFRCNSKGRLVRR